MLVSREKYLSKIRPFYDLDIIKVYLVLKKNWKIKNIRINYQ